MSFNFDENKSYTIEDGKHNGWLYEENSSEYKMNIIKSKPKSVGSFMFKKNKDSYFIKSDGKFLTVTKTLVHDDDNTYITTLLDSPTNYSNFKITFDGKVYYIQGLSPINNQWYNMSIWRGRSDAPFGMSQGYGQDKANGRDNFQYNIKEVLVRPLIHIYYYRQKLQNNVRNMSILLIWLLLLLNELYSVQI